MSEMTIIPDLYLEGNSKQWKNWQAIYLDIKTCQNCRKKHGKIYDFNAERYQPEHERCRCSVIPMRTKEVGTATDRGFDGADAWLLYRNRLPDYYVTKEEAMAAGWRSKKANLHEVLPGKMIGGNIYENKRNLLPNKRGRIWYEADIDYQSGYRNTYRILYSNDGLIFVTYDHYHTFIEIE
jgi:hypothetical protein